MFVCTDCSEIKYKNTHVLAGNKNYNGIRGSLDLSNLIIIIIIPISCKVDSFNTACCVTWLRMVGTAFSFGQPKIGGLRV
jgi:hypothetical protein